MERELAGMCFQDQQCSRAAMMSRVQSQGDGSASHVVTAAVGGSSGWQQCVLVGLVLWHDLEWDPGC